MNKFLYRADIDGLRAFAVLPVILFHVNSSWIPGGFVGVDIFFVISGLYDNTPIVRALNEKLKYRMSGIYFPRREQGEYTNYKEGGVIKSYGDGEIDLMVLGSSHSLMWSPVIDEISKEKGLDTSFYGADGVFTQFEYPSPRIAWGVFSPDQKQAFDEARYRYVKKWKPRIMFLIDRWSHALEQGHDYEKFLSLFDNGITQVVFISEAPLLSIGDNSSLHYLAYTGSPDATFSLHTLEQKEHAAADAKLRGFAQKYGYCHYVNVTNSYLSNGLATFVENGNLIYIDDDHLSYYGILKCKKLLGDVIEQHLEN